jgi:hypothetical protein
MKQLLAGVALAVCAFGQPTGLRVVRSTHQQIIIDYKAPSSAACTLSVLNPASEQAIDTDDAKFTGSNSDLSRTSTYTNGQYRRVVLGERTVGTGVSSVRYSRSLEAATNYTIAVTCGSAATITATTQTIPFGPNLWDEMQGRTDLPGFFNFPTKSFTTRQRFIDSRTGARLRTISIPEDGIFPTLRTNDAISATEWVTPSGTGWTNPTNAIAADGSLATYAGTAQDVMFIGNAFNLTSNTQVMSRINFDFRLDITGSPTGTDRNVQVCMGTLALGCLNAWQTLDASTCSVSVVQGQCDEFGSSGHFDTNWLANGEYMIEGMFNGTVPGLGVMIRKVSVNASHTLRIDSIVANFFGIWNLGMSTSTPRGTSEPKHSGYHITQSVDRLSQGAMLWSFNPTTEDTHYQGGVNFLGSASLGVVYDQTDPRISFFINASSIGKCVIAADITSTDYTGGFAKPATTTCTNITPTNFSVANILAGTGSIVGGPWHPDWDAGDDAIIAATSTQLYSMQGTTGENGEIFIRLSHGQDVAGWILVFDPNAAAPAGSSGQGNIVAARKLTWPGSPQYTKGCMIHSMFTQVTRDWLGFGCARQGISGGTTGNQGGGPWALKVQKPSCNIATENCDVTTAMTTIQLIAQGGSYNWIDPNPHASGMGTELTLEVGDRIINTANASNTQYDVGTDEYWEVLSIDTVANTITVRRGATISASPWIVGTGFTAVANTNGPVVTEGGLVYLSALPTSLSRDDGYGGGISWNYITDPYGNTPIVPPAKSSGPNIINFVNTGNHGTTAINGRVHFGGPAQNTTYYCSTFQTEPCYTFQEFTSMFDQNNWPPVKSIGLWNSFAGNKPVGFLPGYYNSHPRWPQLEAVGRLRNYFSDVRNQDIANSCSNTLVAGTSDVYKVTGCGAIQRKHFATLAVSGDRPLRDISSTTGGNVITDATPWTLCVANTANECRTGSVTGDVYVNSPLRTLSTCTGLIASYPTTAYDICISDTGPYTFGPAQFSLERHDPRGERGRVLAYQDVRPHIQSLFAISEPTIDGTWQNYLGEDHGHTRLYMVKVPPMPEDTTENVLTFARVPVSLYHATATKIRIQFGYAEHGTPTQYFCTSRREACTVDAATITESTPFKFSTDSTTYVNCASQKCVAEIPRLPGRVVFAQAQFFDSGNSLLETRQLGPM